MDIQQLGLVLVVGTISLIIVDNVVASAGFTGLTATVTGFIAIVFAVTLLKIAGSFV